MRLWHENTFGFISTQRLLGQHRECCALRGKGWSKKHSTIDYIKKYSIYDLWNYHQKVIKEMKRRSINVDPLWEDPSYRGKNLDPMPKLDNLPFYLKQYPEHNIRYFQECMQLLNERRDNFVWRK